jgi:hypothetical protein
VRSRPYGRVGVLRRESLSYTGVISVRGMGRFSVDYYQGIVADFVSSDRSRFVTLEFLLDLGNAGSLIKGRYWYIDVLAVDFRIETVFLCEVSYSKSLTSLIRRLKQWSEHWGELCPALRAQTNVPEDWQVQPWVFIPSDLFAVYERGFKVIASPRFQPVLTPLEATPPWKYSARPTAAAKIADLASQGE